MSPRSPRAPPALMIPLRSSSSHDAMMETIDMLIDARMEMKFKTFNQQVDELRHSYDEKLCYIQLEIRDEALACNKKAAHLSAGEEEAHIS